LKLQQGSRVPIAQVAEVRMDQGPNTINRENVQRRIIIQANVADRDLGSVINDVRGAIGSKVQLPQGYFVQYGGQFEAQEKLHARFCSCRLSRSPVSSCCFISP